MCSQKCSHYCLLILKISVIYCLLNIACPIRVICNDEFFTATAISKVFFESNMVIDIFPIALFDRYSILPVKVIFPFLQLKNIVYGYFAALPVGVLGVNVKWQN